MRVSHSETVDRFGLEGSHGAVNDHHDGGESNDHLASIYEDQDDQFETVVPYIQQGLERGEHCLYIADDNTPQEVLDTLREGGIDVEAARDSGALSVHTKTDTYLRTGEFDQEAVFDFLQETLAEVRDGEGYAGVRTAAEMTWALNEGTDLDRLGAYEARANTVCAGSDFVFLCQYNRERFSADVLSDVIRTHPLVISDRTVYQNLCYLSPETFFETASLPLDVDRAVGKLADHAHAQHTLQEIDTLTDEEMVAAALNTILRAASDNDLNLERSYPCRNESPYPDWEVTITLVQKPPETSDEETVTATLTDEGTVGATLTEEELAAAALNAVLRAAYDNGLDLERSYPCRNEPSYPDWEVTITAIKNHS